MVTGTAIAVLVGVLAVIARQAGRERNQGELVPVKVPARRTGRKR